MLVSATAGIGEIRHSRSNMPNTAKELPAATNIMSPRKPCAPIVCSASMPMMIRPATIAKAAEDAAQRQRLVENEARQHETAERRAGRLNDRAVAERHIDVAVIAPQRERQAAEQRDRDGAPPADAAEIAEAAHRGDGNKREPGPDIAVQRQHQRRHADQDAVARGDKAQRPAQSRARAAGDAERGRRALECAN